MSNSGKTTVAEIYGKLLNELGLLSKGEVVLKTPADFIGSVLGESEKKTKAIIENAFGCVLVIDEFYSFHTPNQVSDPYREAAINTLVSLVQPSNLDQCVLILGYKDEVEATMKMNAGLNRRFRLEDAFLFEDYNDEQLTIILQTMAEDSGFKLSLDVAMTATYILAQQRRQPYFGNAGAAANLLTRARENYQARITKSGLASSTKQLLTDDFHIKGENTAKSSQTWTNEQMEKELFGELVANEELVKLIRQYRATIKKCQQQGIDPFSKLAAHFLFVGNSGTGRVL